jgi:hypothetical protein
MVKRKKQAKKSVETPKDGNNKSINQFFWLVGFIFILTLAIFFVPKIYHQVFEKFEYGGVKFEKIQSGNLDFYHGQFPIIYRGNLSAVYNAYFRTDPRKNDIPVNTNFSFNKKVIISLGDDVQFCEDMMLGQIGISQFIRAFPFVKNVTSGVTNLSIAKMYNSTQINCINASSNQTVIIIQKSTNASIDLGDKQNCFVLSIGNCKYIETIERFIMGSIAQVNEKSIN